MKTKNNKEKRHDVQIGLHLWRIGLFIFMREYFKYKSWFILPGVSIDFIKGYDRCISIEIKFLCFGVGVNLIWISGYKFGLFWNIFKRKND